MKIIVMGGSGYLGQGLLQRLVQLPQIDLVSMSHSGGKKVNAPWAKKIKFVATDFVDDDKWKTDIDDADWVVDLVGILREHKEITYNNSIFLPAKKIIDYIAENELPAKFLFVSANWAPFNLQKYMFYKQRVEIYAHKYLPDRNVVVYPNLIYSRNKKSSWLLAKGLNLLGWQKIKPNSLVEVCNEITQIIQGQSSYLTKRR